MAQDLNFKKFIDVDNTVIKPSPQRVRNILTLDEKIAVIKAYGQRPMYKKVARMFNCSWEQIKNIIINRVAIMEFYNAAKNKTKCEAGLHEDDLQMDLKTKFLGECVYECIKRLQYHAKAPITEELIRLKAFEFLDVLCIPGFSPNKKWFNSFKATYNITLCNKQIPIYTKPQVSLDMKDIMAYCTKGKPGRSFLIKYNKDEIRNGEYEAKRMRKLSFLQEALKEYLLRVKFHHKSMKVDTTWLLQVARDFNEILKVQDFKPTTEWVEVFTKQYDNEESWTNAKRPPLSLDLKDILSYCSRMQNKTKDNTVRLTPKETALQMRVLPKYIGSNYPETGLKFQNNSIIYLEDESGEKDVKPDIKEIRVEKPHSEQPPPLKIRKIESINNDPELQRRIPANVELQKAPLVTIRAVPKEPAKNIIYIQNVAESSSREHFSRLTPQPTSAKIKEEHLEDNNYILPTKTIMTASPPAPVTPQLRIQQVHQLASSSSLSPVAHYSPSSTLANLSDDHGELPRHVTSFKDVLLLLKPLEEYAMLKENYRAIGLITQLEEVLKNEPESNEEFIG